MEKLTFEQLPEAVTRLTKEVSELKQLLINKSEQQPIQQPEKLLNIQEAGELLNLTVPTMYSKVSKGELPVMKRSKRLYFSRTELIQYLKAGKRKSSAEIDAEAELYLSNSKKNGRQ
ncbi:DNA binding domain-containing protein, excisionase family [Chryseobacterium ureilyticum]|uniref:DNA binding domain-containing protein, excisionase family n=1 Tax=Chryseobacterium ureilyticum TaxID=373668 RepID=A0A1N7K7J0_9FLAO|nr:helix-turn-helix domain-containing protein [Chryseobacterium ureilyticum]SIS57404.1 DNA binding domain-containing protein, excisionase family [Chryseobacterium ureilyticum]